MIRSGFQKIITAGIKDASVIVKYVLDHEQEIRQATLDEKIELLKVLKNNWDTVNEGQPKPRGAFECQKACFIVLQDEESDISHLQRVTTAIGRDWLSNNTAYFTDAGLQRIAQKGIAN